ncbi:MAG: DUF2786 domain-containing protein [Rickettsiales bacterium]
MDEKLREKIRKLLRLAQKAGTEGEAAAAMERVRFLLAKHNLSTDDVPDEGEECDITEEETACEPWNRTIFKDVARLYFCDAVLVKRIGKTSVAVVGGKENVRVAVGTAKAIVAAGRRFATAYAENAPSRKGAERSFKYGFAARIGERCQEMIFSAKHGAPAADSETGTEVALQGAYEKIEGEIKEYFDRKGVKAPRSPRRVVGLDGISFHVGVHMADAQELGREAVEQAAGGA